MAMTAMPPEVEAYVIDSPIPDVRFGINEYNIFAPPGYCGDLNCVCANEARRWMTSEEWRLSYGTCELAYDS